MFLKLLWLLYREQIVGEQERKREACSCIRKADGGLCHHTSDEVMRSGTNAFPLADIVGGKIPKRGAEHRK